MKNERNAAPIRTRQREKITALPAVFFNKGKEVRPNRQSLFFGVLGNQIPFRAVKRDAAPDALIVNGGSACIGAFAAPVPLAHCFPAYYPRMITNNIRLKFVLPHIVNKIQMPQRGFRPPRQQSLLKRVHRSQHHAPAERLKRVSFPRNQPATVSQRYSFASHKRDLISL